MIPDTGTGHDKMADHTVPGICTADLGASGFYSLPVAKCICCDQKEVVAWQQVIQRGPGPGWKM